MDANEDDDSLSSLITDTLSAHRPSEAGDTLVYRGEILFVGRPRMAFEGESTPASANGAVHWVLEGQKVGNRPFGQGPSTPGWGACSALGLGSTAAPAREKG